jgi:hypothetical protein
MQQATFNTAIENISNSATVVLKDTARVFFTHADGSDADDIVGTPLVTLNDIAEERKQWEVSAYRTSNQQLYAILAKCYAFYQLMAEDGDKGKALREQLNNFIEKHGLRFTKGSHGITKVLKCVFFDGEKSVDRRRISTYSIVLRSALALNIAPHKLAEHIETAGGVQELRLAKSPNAKSAKQKAELGKECVFQNVILATMRSDEVTCKLDFSDYDKPLAAIVVVRADGTIELRDVLTSTGAANTVLAAHYSASNDSKAQKAA